MSPEQEAAADVARLGSANSGWAREDLDRRRRRSHDRAAPCVTL